MITIKCKSKLPSRSAMERINRIHYQAYKYLDNQPDYKMPKNKKKKEYDNWFFKGDPQDAD